MTDPANDTTRRRFEVAGRVQGVGYRVWTVRRADALGLTGTVFNREDGSVEVELEGASEAVWRMRELLSRGPELARVRSLRELEPRTERLRPGMHVIYR